MKGVSRDAAVGLRLGLPAQPTPGPVRLQLEEGVEASFSQIWIHAVQTAIAVVTMKAVTMMVPMRKVAKPKGVDLLFILKKAVGLYDDGKIVTESEFY